MARHISKKRAESARFCSLWSSGKACGSGTFLFYIYILKLSRTVLSPPPKIVELLKSIYIYTYMFFPKKTAYILRGVKGNPMSHCHLSMAMPKSIWFSSFPRSIQSALNLDVFVINIQIIAESSSPRS